jgi:hypothetical protein
MEKHFSNGVIPPIISQETKETNFQSIAPQKAEPVMVRTKEHKKSSFGLVAFILFLVAAGATYWFYRLSQTLQAKVGDLQNQVKAEQQKNLADLNLSPLERLNKHMLLPQAQNAQISTLSNVSDLKQSDTFFEYAQNGNMFFQFPNLDVIYDPNADVIINARTKNTGQVAGVEARAVQGAISLEVRNGSGVAGAAGKVADTFKGVGQYVVKSVGNASKNTYAKITLVNLSGKDVSGLEKQFGVKAVTVLPAGEKSAQVDVVIIVGK